MNKKKLYINRNFLRSLTFIVIVKKIFWSGLMMPRGLNFIYLFSTLLT